MYLDLYSIIILTQTSVEKLRKEIKDKIQNIYIIIMERPWDHHNFEPKFRQNSKNERDILREN